MRLLSNIQKWSSRWCFIEVFRLSSESFCLFHLPFTLHIGLGLCRNRTDLHHALGKHSQPSYIVVSWLARMTTVYRAEPFPLEMGIPGQVIDRL